MTLKDQPIDIPEFERLWDEVEYHWRNIQTLEQQYLHPLTPRQWESYYDSRDQLRAIKHRLFNSL